MKSKIILLALGMTTLFSCESDDKTYTDCTKVRFEKSKCSVEISPFVKGSVDVAVPVTVIGKSNSDLNYEVRVSNGAESLKNGFISFNSSNTMAGGKYVDTVHFKLNPDLMKENETVSLTVSLVANNEDAVAHNYADCDMNIHKQQLVEFLLGKYDCFESTINGSYPVHFLADGNSDTTILNDNFWNFNAAGAKLRYVLHRADQTVVIPEQTWMDSAYVSYQVYGNGKFFEDGSLVVDYVMMHDEQLFEKGTHKFSKQQQ